METSKLRKFASFARSALLDQIGTRLKSVLAEKSLARRESPNVVEELEKKIKELGEKRLIETVAYTWFNRFCALRYMDVNRYTRIGVLSPADGQFQPEILAEAKMGHIDEELVPESSRKRVIRLLDGSDPSADPQGEAYRLLLVAVCNYYHTLMPFMFEKIADYTELLLPDDLLSGTSIPAYTREALLPINCSPEHTDESVEVIGWLYQFYIADKKDEVFEGLKKGKKITAENIPAATQLFTPHWIVRYLLENSLGRLWMLNHPESRLVERMDYYIKPEEPESEFLKVSRAEEIKICDPACGSGHMLTYAFDLLYEIYREEQYPEPEIPALILQNNLFGIEIDHRAGALAAFALTMKAREKDKRFFTRKSRAVVPAGPLVANLKSQIPNPHICVLENIQIDPADLSAYINKVGRDLFSGGLQGVVNQWEEADNFGSLIRPLVTNAIDVLELIRERQVGENLFLANVHQKVLKALRQADFLSPKYHVVVANPPYMGSGGMNANLKKWVYKHFPAAKADLYAAFISRNLSLASVGGYVAMITMHSWMFLSSYEDLRREVLHRQSIVTLAHLGPHAFDSIGGEVVSTTAFTIRTACANPRRGAYFRLVDEASEESKRVAFLDSRDSPFIFDSPDFDALPGTPLAFWVGPAMRSCFANNPPLSQFVETRIGLITGDNDAYIRFWHEVDFKDIGFDLERKEAAASGLKWFPQSKGGDSRRWFGNNETVLNWSNDGHTLQTRMHPAGTRTLAHNFNLDRIFQRAITWTKISGQFAARLQPRGFLFNDASANAFVNAERDENSVLGFLCSTLPPKMLSAINPTLNFLPGSVGSLPFPIKRLDVDQVNMLVTESVDRAKRDWDSHERSYEFSVSPLYANGWGTSLSACFQHLRQRWNEASFSQCLCENRLNALFIAAFGLESELDASVQLSEITLDCNPSFRYGTNKSNLELESLLLADTMREFVSYAVGCIFGRFSLDRPGLILANKNETIADYRDRIPLPAFVPSESNVVPIIDGEWFDDDISQRFKEFLRVTFGAEHYDQNLQFLENALYPDNSTAKTRKTIRDYLLKEFYDHHLKIYKKRPIYWLFSSPKGTFNALVYVHRYRSDTVGTVLQYARDFRDKLAHHAEHRQMTADSASASKAERTQAIKEVVSLKKQIKELDDYEKTLFALAAEKIDIDLDNGVKHNYSLFGTALEKIPGLDSKSDE